MAATTVAAVVTLTGCSGSTDTTDSTTTEQATTTADTTSAAEAESGDFNDADVQFVRGMITHHEQAVEMSDIILAKSGINPDVTALAEEIKSAQGPEIEEMQSWLDDWGQDESTDAESTDAGGTDAESTDVESTGAEGTESEMDHSEMDHSDDDQADMSEDMHPTEDDASGGGEASGEMDTETAESGDMGDMGHGGMMSSDELDALRSAEGVAASRLFLEQMIAHHEGAVAMAQDYQPDGRNPDTQRLAEQIITDQTAEIERMRELLTTL